MTKPVAFTASRRNVNDPFGHLKWNPVSGQSLPYGQPLYSNQTILKLVSLLEQAVVEIETNECYHEDTQPVVRLPILEEIDVVINSIKTDLKL